MGSHRLILGARDAALVVLYLKLNIVLISIQPELDRSFNTHSRAQKPIAGLMPLQAPSILMRLWSLYRHR